MSPQMFSRRSESVGFFSHKDLSRHESGTIMAMLRSGYNDATVPIYEKINSNEYLNLQRRVKALEKQIAELTSLLHDLPPKEIVIRDIGRKEAKKEIRKFFKEHHGESIDPSVIVENLRIDIGLAIELCAELEREGKIRSL
jgi:hypothetical protein